MGIDDAEKISILMMQINANIDQSVALVKDKSSEDEFVEYRQMAGQAMGRVIDILNSLYIKHPELKPKQLGGTYEVAPSVFEKKFYSGKNS